MKKNTFCWILERIGLRNVVMVVDISTILDYPEPIVAQTNIARRSYVVIQMEQVISLILVLQEF